jgi:hypothetical protein
MKEDIWGFGERGVGTVRAGTSRSMPICIIERRLDVSYLYTYKTGSQIRENG